MIFKTFNNDIDKWTAKIGVFGKSFNAIFDAKSQRKIDINDLIVYKGMSLDEAQKQVGSFWSYLYPKKEDIQKQLIDIDSLIPEIDKETFDFDHWINELNDIDKQVKEGTKSWQDYSNGLKDNQKWIAKWGQETEGQIRTQSDLVKANQQAREAAIAHNNALKQQTLGAKAATVATRALAMAGNMIAMWGITEVVSGLYELSQVSKTVANNAKELGDSFKTTSSDIDDYKSEIEELYSTINDSSSSIEDVTNARQTLMSVQDELIDKFGTEKSVINDVTDAINGQTEALDRLTNAKWQETKNDFNDGGFWNDVANWSQGYEDNIDRMIDEMENAREILAFSYNDFTGKNGDFSEIKRQIEQLGWVYKDTLGGYVKEGNLEGIYSDILKIQDLVENFDAPDMLIKDLTEDANSIKSTLDDYEDMWNTYVLQDRIFADKDLADSFKNINDAYAEYQKAFASGDEESITKAQDNFANILTQATKGLNDQSVIDYFNNMYPTLQSVVKSWQFNIAFDSNTDDLQGKVQTVLDKLKDENGRSLTAEEILGLGEVNEQYQKLDTIAHSYNMTLEEMIELLKERNLISAMDYQGLVGLFGQEDVDKLSPEDLEIAYQIKNVGNMTFEELQAEIQKLKESADENPISLSISDTIDQLNTRLKPAFDSLKSAYQDIFTDDGFTLENVGVDMLNSIKSSIDELNSMEGVDINIDSSAFEEFARVLSNTSSTAEDVQNQFDQLSNTIVRSTNCTEVNSETFDVLTKSLEDMGLVNAREVLEEIIQAQEEFIAVSEQLGLTLEEVANATYEETVQMLIEAQAADQDTQALWQLAVAQGTITDGTIATESNVDALLAEAQAAGLDAAMLTALENVRNGNIKDTNAAQAILEQTRKELQESMSSFKLDFDFSPAVKSAGKAGKSAGETFKDALEEELSDLESVISGITGRIDDQISSINEQKSAALDALDEEKEALEEAKDAAVEALEAERDARLEVIEAQKEQLEEQIKLIDKQIEQKQDEIDAINEAIETRQREIDLQKAQYELERMQNQRTKLVNYMPDTIVI